MSRRSSGGSESEEEDEAKKSSKSNNGGDSEEEQSGSGSGGSDSESSSGDESDKGSGGGGGGRSDSSEEEGSGDDNRSRKSRRSGSSSGGESRSRSEESNSDGEGSVGGGSGGARSRSGSDDDDSSGGGSQGSHNSGSSVEEAKRRRRKQREKEKLWENDPELYGIRRSNRPRYESKPPKLEPQQSSSGGHKRKSSHKSHASSAGKVKRRKISTDDDDTSDEESTRAIRKRGSSVNYKDAESDDEADMMTDLEDGDESQDNINGDLEPEEHVETIERVMESRIGKKGATGSCTTSYAIEEKGDPNETLPPETETERQFLIKWVGWSHLHNTWEGLGTLTEMKAKGLKKLDNFCKKEDDHSRWKSYASPEDAEYVECQLELQQDLVKLYVNAERIIADRTNEEGIKEYYVKWECLSYAEATWENADLIKKKNPEAIKLFKRREASTRTPSASSKCLKQRPKFSAMKSQPDFLKGDAKDLILRDYQVDGVNWLVHSWCKENSVILADEMGLGKTIQTICFLNYLFETYNLYGPYLLVVPLSTMTAWQKEFAQWAPNMNVVTYLGDISSRDVIREYEWFFQGSRKIKFNAILTTYEIVLKDKAVLMTVPWAAMMVDEAHRLKNGDSLLYKTLVDFESNHRLLITGTPLQNSLKELWSLLHFIMPGKFDNWEAFEEEHDQAANKGYAKLHKQLEPYIIRRVKKDVEKSLPAKVEQILRVEMTKVQKQYYKWILTKNYVALKKGVKGSVTSFVNVVMELKKCCNHASLIKPLESAASDALSTLIKGSGKLMLLDKLLVRLKETGHRVLIFSQMVMMLDIIAEYLQLRRFAFQRLDGSIKGDMRKQALDHFNAEGSSDFCFLLSTRAGGLGINLATADTVIIFDSDWNPQNDLQAQARAHRIGQKNQVMIYRLVTKQSVEEDIVERAKRKMVLDHLVIQRMDTTGRTVLDKGSKAGTPFNKDELSAILKFGAEELFKDEGDNEGGDDNCDIDEILRRAETHEEAARPGDDLLSAFKVATFSVNEDDLPEVTNRQPGPGGEGDPKDWDQIIPEDLRKQVESEEREKEMADLYLPPRSRTTTSAAAGDAKPALGNEALNRKARNRKRKRGDKVSDEEEDESESDAEGGRKSKKRGRPKHGKEPKYTEVQVRKFLKSLKKFASPLQRIEKVAEDCGMSDRPVPELKKLAQELLEGCQQAVADQKAHPQMPVPVVKEEPSPAPSQQPSEGGDSAVGADGVAAKKRANKPREKGPIFKVHGCSINARTMSIAIDELEALGILIPLDEEARKKWKFDLKVKNAAFDIDWAEEEDTRALLGVWEHGMGAWDKILETDPVLKSKIFTEGDKKPLVKHAGSRVDYLLRVMKKHVAVQRLKQPKIKKKKEGKKNGAKANKEGVDGAAAAVDGATPGEGVVGGAATGKKGSSKKEGKKKRGRKKKDDMPKHFAAGAEPTPVSMLGELDPKIFNQCKEMMRPVKKALKALDNRDVGEIDSKEYQIQHKTNLRQIGKQIEVCLEEHKQNEENYRLWKSYLWYFVSKFTEFEAKMLHKNYKKLKKIDEKDSKKGGGEGQGEKKPKKDKEKREKHHRNKDKADRKGGSRARGKMETEHSQSSFHENSNSSMDGFRRREAPPQYQADGKAYTNKYNRNEDGKDSRIRGYGGGHNNHIREDQPHKYRFAPPSSSDGIANNHYDNRNSNRTIPGGRPADPRDRRDERRAGGHPIPPHDPRDRGGGRDPRDIKARGVMGGSPMNRDDNVPSAGDPRAAGVGGGSRGGRYPSSDEYRGHPPHPPPSSQNYPSGYHNNSYNSYNNSSSSRW